MSSTETPDSNGDRYCTQRWNHRDEVTIIENKVKWCPACLSPSLATPSK